MKIPLSDLGKAPAKARKVDVGTLVAEPGFAPRVWQSAAPDDMSWKPPVDDSPDLRRIVALPRRDRPDEARGEALIELMTSRFAKSGACNCADLGRECITRLRLAQAWALFEVGMYRGLLGPVGVGHGKTMLDLLTPLAIPGCKVALLLIPAALVDQLMAEYALVANHFRIPSLIVHGREWTHVEPGAPVLHVLSYERLSLESSAVFLRDLHPDVVIADEVHRLRHATATRTARVLKFFATYPQTRFCGWSGSLTDSSLRDYAHLSALALREKSPLPLDKEVVDDWARAIDPGDWCAPPGALLELCEPGEHIHEGFHRRLVESPGVVSTTSPAIDALLEITERKAPPVPTSVQVALIEVRATWVRPDGEDLIDAMQVSRCCRELAAGFYYRWIFPRGEKREVIEEWFAARKAWRKEMRERLKDRRDHLDSPLLVAKAAIRGWEHGTDLDRLVMREGLPCWRAATWPRWQKARPTVEPETEAVRVDDYLARDAAEWGRSHRGVIWYEHTAFGLWVAELSGLPHHGGGPEAGERIAKERGKTSIVASIKSHGTGRDGLQRLFSEQLVANPPSSATTWEQMLGRLHRIGQKAPVVRAEFYRHTEELRDHVDQALRRALYVQGTLGSAQKLRTGWALGE